METYLDKLVLSHSLSDPAIGEAIRTLELPEGSRGLDAGCGIGRHTLLLAEADREEFRRLADPQSPDFILGSPDYYAFFTYSMFEGRAARDEGK